jgi:hypothetical protein
MGAFDATSDSLCNKTDLGRVETAGQPLAEFDLADEILRSEGDGLSPEERKSAIA